MQLKLTLEQLQAVRACDEGLKAFASVFDLEAEACWTREKQIEILKGPLGRYLGWAWGEGLIPMWSLRSADLRWANLSSANLRLADLRSADLSLANLSSADLSSADLRSADLSLANLSSADLSSADLRSADLSSADLRSANVGTRSLYAAMFRDFGWEIDEAGRLQRAKQSTGEARGDLAGHGA